MNNPNIFAQNQTSYYNNAYNPNANSQPRQNPIIVNANYNPYLQQQNLGPIGPSGGIGILVNITDLFKVNMIYNSFSVQRLTMRSFFNHVQ